MAHVDSILLQLKHCGNAAIVVDPKIKEPA